jgi:hypothetical protein
MTGYEVLFDTVGSGRIGFAMSDCNYTRIVNSTSQQVISNGPVKSPTVAPPTKSPTKTSGSQSAYASIMSPSVGLALSVLLALVYNWC